MSKTRSYSRRIEPTAKARAPTPRMLAVSWRSPLLLGAGVEEAAPAVELAEDESLLEPVEAPGVLTELPPVVEEPVAEADADAEEDLVEEAEAEVA